MLADGSPERIEDRYGVLAGTIEPAGLSAVDERFAYVALSHYDAAAWSAMTADGWGRPRSPPWWADPARSAPGETDTINPAAYPLATVAILALVPAGVLLFVARGIGASERRRWQWLLATLGAGPAELRLARIGELARPALLAGAGGLAMAAITANITGRLPLTGYVLPTAALAHALPILLVCVGSAWGFGLLILLRASAPRGGRSATTPTSPDRSPVRRVAPLLTPVAIVAASGFPSCWIRCTVACGSWCSLCAGRWP